MTTSWDWAVIYESQIRPRYPRLPEGVFTETQGGASYFTGLDARGHASFSVSTTNDASVEIMWHEAGHAAHTVAATLRDKAEGRGTAGDDIISEVSAILTHTDWLNPPDALRNEYVAEAFRKANTGNVVAHYYPDPPGQHDPFPRDELLAYFRTMDEPRVSTPSTTVSPSVGEKLTTEVPPPFPSSSSSSGGGVGGYVELVASRPSISAWCENAGRLIAEALARLEGVPVPGNAWLAFAIQCRRETANGNAELSPGVVHRNPLNLTTGHGAFTWPGQIGTYGGGNAVEWHGDFASFGTIEAGCWACASNYANGSAYNLVRTAFYIGDPVGIGEAIQNSPWESGHYSGTLADEVRQELEADMTAEEVAAIVRKVLADDGYPNFIDAVNRRLPIDAHHRHDVVGVIKTSEPLST